MLDVYILQKLGGFVDIWPAPGDQVRERKMFPNISVMVIFFFFSKKPAWRKFSAEKMKPIYWKWPSSFTQFISYLFIFLSVLYLFLFYWKKNLLSCISIPFPWFCRGMKELGAQERYNKSLLNSIVISGRIITKEQKYYEQLAEPMELVFEHLVSKTLKSLGCALRC